MSSVKLIKLELNHSERLFKIANEHDIWINVRDAFPHPYTHEDARFFIEHVASKKENIIRGIFYKGILAGGIGVHPQTDVYARSAEIGYWLAKDYWGKGITTQAVSKMCKLAFKELEIIRIYAGVFDYNLGSQKVLTNNGFKFEGCS